MSLKSLVDFRLSAWLQLFLRSQYESGFDFFAWSIHFCRRFFEKQSLADPRSDK